MASLARVIASLGNAEAGYLLTVLDPHGRLTVWGATAERLTGYPAGEAVGRPFSALWADPGKTETVLRRARSDGEPVVDDAYLAPKQGERLLTRRRVSSFDDDDGTWAGYVAMINVTSPTTSPPAVPDGIAKAVLDTVVHPIFAAGLELNGLLSMTTDPRLRQRVVTSIERLDEALRNLRGAIGSMPPTSDPR